MSAQRQALGTHCFLWVPQTPCGNFPHQNLEVSEKVLIFANRNKTCKIMSYSQMAQQIADYLKTQPVVKVWIFGSFARGEENANSDVDLLIQFDHSTPIGLFSYARMHRELEERLGRKVDLVEEGTLRPAAAAAAKKDMKMIYERVA
jgi:predicted nucleotidyltransferase